MSDSYSDGNEMRGRSSATSAGHRQGPTIADNSRQFCRVETDRSGPGRNLGAGVHRVGDGGVTLTFDGGTRKLHWCAEHATDAERYRADSDQAA